MLRSPDDPNSKLAFARADGNTSEATRGAHERHLQVRHRGRIFPGRRRDQIGRARHAAGVSDGAKAATGGQVMGELLQSQIEVRPFRITTSRPRAPSCAICARPWRTSPPSTVSPFWPPAPTRPRLGQVAAVRGERYDAVMDDLQMIGQRNMLCGMHVHVELPDPDDRVDVMTRMLPYLPLFIALATSSPFWRSRRPGSRATGSPPMTSCRAPACRSCSAPRRSSTPTSPRW